MKTALIMIDFQRDFCAPGGYASQSYGTAWVDSILAPAKHLLEQARQQSWMIIHTREGYAPDLSDLHPLKLEKSKRIGAEIGSQGPLGRFLIRGEQGHDILEELYPLPGEAIIDKSSYSAFYQTDLQQILEDQGIEKLVFAGVTADACVHSTLRDAVERGYQCIYVKDAISAFDPVIRCCCEQMVEAEGGIWGSLCHVDELFDTSMQETNS